MTADAKLRLLWDGSQLTAGSRQAERDLRDVESASERTDGAMGRLGTSVLASASAFLSLQTATRSIEAFAQQERATLLLDNAMQSMGRNSEVLRGQIHALANQIQSEGIVGDEAVLKAAQFAATFTNISDDVMPRAIRLAADFAAFTGGEVSQAAIILGKASEGMVGELKRYGISISDATMESKDFNAILSEIEQQVGGANKALGDAKSGGFDQLKNAIGDVSEELGELALDEFGEDIRQLTEFLKENKVEVAEWAGELSGAAVALGLLRFTPVGAVVAGGIYAGGNALDVYDMYAGGGGNPAEGLELLKKQRAAAIAATEHYVGPGFDPNDLSTPAHKIATYEKLGGLEIEQKIRELENAIRQQELAQQRLRENVGAPGYQSPSGGVLGGGAANASVFEAQPDALLLMKARDLSADELAIMKGTLDGALRAVDEYWAERERISLERAQELSDAELAIMGGDSAALARSRQHEDVNFMLNRQRATMQFGGNSSAVAYMDYQNAVRDAERNVQDGVYTDAQGEDAKEIALLEYEAFLADMESMTENTAFNIRDLFDEALSIDTSSLEASLISLQPLFEGLATSSLKGGKAMEAFAKQFAASILQKLAAKAAELAFVMATDAVLSPFIGPGTFARSYYGDSIGSAIFGGGADPNRSDARAARRFHGGGYIGSDDGFMVPGGAANERMIVAKVGERVDTGASSSAGGGTTVNIINNGPPVSARVVEDRDKIIGIVMDDMNEGAIGRLGESQFGWTRQAG